MSRLRPHVIALISVSWDGRVVFPRGAYQLGSLHQSPEAATDLFASADAILSDVSTQIRGASITGGGERIRLNPELQKRAGAGSVFLRALVSEDGCVDPGMSLFRNGAAQTVVYSTERMTAKAREELKEVAAVRLCTGEVFQASEMMASLASEFGVRRLLCVGGGNLFGTLLRAGCVDELWLTFLPQIFGNKWGETLSGSPGMFLPASVKASLFGAEQVGEECFTRWKLKFGREFSRKG